MDWGIVCQRYADSARPTCIYLLGGSLGLGPFLHADIGLASLSAAAFGVLVGARSTENVFQTKADASVKTTTIQATSPSGATVTATQGAGA